MTASWSTMKTRQTCWTCWTCFQGPGVKANWVVVITAWFCSAEPSCRFLWFSAGLSLTSPAIPRLLFCSQLDSIVDSNSIIFIIIRLGIYSRTRGCRAVTLCWSTAAGRRTRRRRRGVKSIPAEELHCHGVSETGRFSKAGNL